MSSTPEKGPCGGSELVAVHALDALPAADASALEAHLSECAECRQELQRLRSVVDSFVAWPSDVLRPSASLQARLAARIAEEAGSDPLLPPSHEYSEPEWEEVAPGIFCKILSSDTETDRVTMLVRLLPGVSYPPHTHAGIEELHLLDGELWIEDRLLYPGDYNYGAPGHSDQRVYSETGCTCVLITSPSDILR
jgi:anti-sigma factor ChrR (cupin superfamily)